MSSPADPVTAAGQTMRLGGIGATVRLVVAGAGAAALAGALREPGRRCLVEAGPDDASSAVVTAVYDPRAPAPPPADGDVVGGSDLAALLPRVTQAITRALIGARAGELLLLHAGAVCDPETGRTVVFVAPGGTGKTTLVRTLATRYGYLTDETVAIDAEHRVLPYPKPLSVRDAAGPKRELSPDGLALVPAPEHAEVARLVLLARDDAHRGPVQVTELALLDAIEQIAAQSSALYALPRGLRFLARLIETTGPVLQVHYRDAVDLSGLVAELLDAPASPAHAVEPTTPAARHAEDDSVEPAGPEGGLRVHACGIGDVLERGGEALVLRREGGLIRLSALGAAIVELAVNPIPLTRLAGALAHRFGAPVGGTSLELATALVNELADLGVLALGEPPLPSEGGPFWRISDDAAFVTSGEDQVVVLNLAAPSEQPKALLGSGAAIWRGLVGPEDDPRQWIDEHGLLAGLATSYDTEVPVIETEVRGFLHEMRAAGYLVTKPCDEASLGVTASGH